MNLLLLRRRAIQRRLLIRKVTCSGLKEETAAAPAAAGGGGGGGIAATSTTVAPQPPPPAAAAAATALTTTTATAIAPSSAAISPSSAAIAPSSAAIAPSSAAISPSSAAIAPSSAAIAPSSAAIAPSSAAIAPSSAPSAAPAAAAVAPAAAAAVAPAAAAVAPPAAAVVAPAAAAVAPPAAAAIASTAAVKTNCNRIAGQRGSVSGAGSVTAPTVAGGSEEEETEEDNIEEVYEAVLDAEASKHCVTILRAQVGDSVRVGVFNGGICEAKIIEIEPNNAIVKVRLPRDIRRDPPPGDIPLVDLLVALPRPKTLDKILQVAATLGVGRLLFVCARRSERGYLDSPKVSFENISKQLRTGLEQGVATRLPEVHVFASWGGLLAFLRPYYSPCPLHTAEAAEPAETASTKRSDDSSDSSRFLLLPHREVREKVHMDEISPISLNSAGGEGFEQTDEREKDNVHHRHHHHHPSEANNPDDVQQQTQKQRHEQPLHWQIPSQAQEVERPLMQETQGKDWQKRGKEQKQQTQPQRRTPQMRVHQTQQVQQHVNPLQTLLPLRQREKTNTSLPSGSPLWCCFNSRVGRSRRLVAHPDAPHSLPALQLQSQSAGRVLVAVGPEGGWLPDELEELQQQQHFVPFHLGDRVLRCETAVVSILTQVNLLLTDSTLRNGLPPPVTQGTFSACLASQSPTTPAGSRRNSSCCSSNCASRDSTSSTRSKDTRVPAGQAAGPSTRTCSLASRRTKGEDVFLSECTCSAPPQNTPSSSRCPDISRDNINKTCLSGKKPELEKFSKSIGKSSKRYGSDVSACPTGSGYVDCNSSNTKNASCTCSKEIFDDKIMSVGRVTPPTHTSMIMHSPELCNTWTEGNCKVNSERALLMFTLEPPFSSSVGDGGQREKGKKLDIPNSSPESTPASMEKVEKKTVTKNCALDFAADLDTTFPQVDALMINNVCPAELSGRHDQAVRPSSSALENRKSTKKGRLPAENDFTPAQELTYPDTAALHRDTSAVRSGMGKGPLLSTVSNNDSGKGTLRRNSDNNINSCTKGCRRRTEEYSRNGRACDRVSRSLAPSTEGYAVTHIVTGEGAQGEGLANEDEQGDRCQEVRTGECSAASSGGDAVERQNDNIPPGMATASAREGNRERKVCLEKTEVIMSQKVPRGIRLIYRDEDGFYIVFPERRHATTDVRNV